VIQVRRNGREEGGRASGSASVGKALEVEFAILKRTGGDRRHRGTRNKVGHKLDRREDEEILSAGISVQKLRCEERG